MNAFIVISLELLCFDIRQNQENKTKQNKPKQNKTELQIVIKFKLVPLVETNGLSFLQGVVGYQTNFS